jgi:NAD(P)-dependent dehydrogenase (short-subunit alcohol dehydrogenase family)
MMSAEAFRTRRSAVTWSESDIPDQAGQVAIVTGANSGIGYETARALAVRGARVVLACRNPDKGQAAEARIRQQAPDAQVRFRPLDLASLSSIAAFAKEFAAEERRLDLLCNNAGVMMPPLGYTADGFETQFGTNHLGHFALTGRLLERIRAAGRARIVTVSSLAHFAGRIRFDDLDASRRYNATLAYGQSKVANLLFMRELQRRLEGAHIGAVSLAAHPGSTRTNLQQHSRLMRGIVGLFSQEAPDGALPTLYAATAPGVRGGDYFGPSGAFGCIGPPGPARSSRYSKDPAVARRLWEISEELTGVSYGI